MNVKKFSLYKEITPKIIDEYSKFKFGDPKIMKRYAIKLSEIIKLNLPENKKIVLYATNKFPTQSYFKKNSLILAEKISKIIKIPLIVGEYSYNYNRDNFYDESQKRIAHIPHLKDKNRYVGYVFIMVDDSIFTGKSLAASIKDLRETIQNLLFFSVITGQNQKYSEKEINDSYYNKIGVKYLIKLFNKRNYKITTHMLRTIDRLGLKQKVEILKNIGSRKKRILVKSFKEYIKKDLI
jgi:hypothetical protein